MTSDLVDRYASGFALWRAEHPGEEARWWRYPGERVRRDLIDALQRRIVRAVYVRWLVTLPEITDDALPWLRALPQEDQDAVVVMRATGMA